MKLKVAALLACLLCCAPGVQAGTIIVSGDVNIRNGIDGSVGFPIGDNGQFFQNILGAGTSVLFQTGFVGPTTGPAYTAIANLYSGLPGVTQTTITSAPSAGQLAGVDLFLSALPLVPYTAGDLSVLASFLAAGGTVFFLGDNAGSAAQDNIINAALAAVGSTLSLQVNSLDPGIRIAAGGRLRTTRSRLISTASPMRWFPA